MSEIILHNKNEIILKVTNNVYKMSIPGKGARHISSIAASYATITSPPIDLSMRELREFSEMKIEENQNAGEYQKLVKKYGKDNVIINAIRLNNNKISGWVNFITSLRSMVEITQIQWLDLSFNQLQTIEPTIGRLRGLVKLHLHANKITDILDVNKLVELENLRDLTLHGNPIEDRGRLKYRNYIISVLPNLNSLDFTSLTARDKAIASSFCSNKSLKKTVFTEAERAERKRESEK